MKNNLKLYLLSIAAVVALPASGQWSPAGNHIKTRWAEQVDPANVLAEYPRPQMVREKWLNLNGLWEYAITERGAAEPEVFDGEILVPFAVESSLSGVMKRVTDRQELWYRTTFTVPSNWETNRILLHFGAVDWQAEVFVNDVCIGSHTGGYTPFSFDITPFLAAGMDQKLTLRVWDPTDKGYGARGKQVSKPGGIWYTPVSGIWQTVWLEPVPAAHISHIKAIPDLDNKYIAVTVGTSEHLHGDVVEINLYDDGVAVASAKGVPGETLRLSQQEWKLWNPDSPHLYDMTVSLWRNGKVIDAAGSYTAMRKIGTRRDDKGVVRMTLNNELLFHMGPLDQGWWPDGLYTAPTDEALLYDIVKTKEWGFNMIRKHVKVEPARWYYHCDRVGLLVWQDMPNSSAPDGWWQDKIYNGGRDVRRSPVSKENFYHEWREIMDLCLSHPSVVVWVPFNEAWGQFDTEEVAAWTASYDPSRLVNPASGGNHRDCGDILDLHNYPGPRLFLNDPHRVNVMGEYGGIGLALENHLWNKNMDNWGYINSENTRELTDTYVKYGEELIGLVKASISAGVYTQTTDVEGEVNGIMTYDREVVKFDEARLREMNRRIIRSMTE